ncbi:chitin-binding type-2 domain-containing protein [Trichonephila clavipes]|nr:chitin-binding type-2 domain-containing protein [Trichonephila clavipes]
MWIRQVEELTHVKSVDVQSPVVSVVVDMEFSSVIVLLSILACTAVGQHHEDVADEFHHSEAPAAAIRYMECMEHGHCSDNSGELKKESVINEEVPIEENKYEENKYEEIVQNIGSHEDSSYFHLCEKFNLKMKELESEYPELKAMKRELLKKLYVYSSQFDSKLNRDESIILRLLAFLINVAEKLKVDYTKIIHEKQIAKPITIDPLPVEEIIAEDDYAPLVGSIRGIPGVHYPDYSEIPVTSFTCSDKKYVPGFYADLETGCQVFHVCYEHRRESFLCPIGTTFNQPILACDYWYSSNCSLAPHYYYVNEMTKTAEVSEEDEDVEKLIATLIEGDEMDSKNILVKDEMKSLLNFLPVKAKVEDFPEVHKPIAALPLKDVGETADKIFEGLVSSGTKVITKANKMLETLPEPEIFIVPKIVSPFPVKSKTAAEKIVKAKSSEALYMTKLGSKAAKAKLVSASIPIIKAKAISASVPVVKAKAAAIPVVKAKIAAAATFPIVKAKVAKAAAVPVMTAKIAAAAAVPVVKAKVAKAAAVPVMTAKIAAAAAAPVVKAKVAKAAAIPAMTAKIAAAAAVPVVKAKVAKAAAIPAMTAKISAAAAVPVVKAKVAKAAAIPAMTAKISAAAAVPVVKAKVAKAASIPAMTAKISAAAAVPVVKAKVAKAAAIPAMTAKIASAAAVPVGKAKVAKAAAIPVAKVKVSSAMKIPFIKSKFLALPLAKTKLGAGAIPVIKAKKAAKTLPYVKMAALKPKFVVPALKMKSIGAGIPLAKAKLAKAAMISPLTKKALAVGYMKLLKAKKLALMG